MSDQWAMSLVAEQARFLRDLIRGQRAAHERQFAAWRERDLGGAVDLSRRLSILDLASGRLRPQYTLLKRAGHHVVGIDLVNRPRRDATAAAYQMARWLYVRSLGSYDASATPDTLVCGDVGALPFRDDTFDIVSSVAAFEHFLDVPAVVAELHRVVRPRGLLWACVHLFTSPSGGHNVSLTEVPLRALPRGVDAWDHLRRRRLPFHVPLNQWRRDQYLAAIGRQFEILKHYCAIREGEAWVTPEIRAELAAFGEDELTCGSYVIVARKTG